MQTTVRGLGTRPGTCLCFCPWHKTESVQHTLLKPSKRGGSPLPTVARGGQIHVVVVPTTIAVNFLPRVIELVLGTGVTLAATAALPRCQHWDHHDRLWPLVWYAHDERGSWHTHRAVALSPAVPLPHRTTLWVPLRLQLLIRLLRRHNELGFWGSYIRMYVLRTQFANRVCLLRSWRPSSLATEMGSSWMG